MSRADLIKNIIIGFIPRFVEVCGTAEPAKIQQLLDISYQTAWNYLNGDRLPDPSILIVIAERTPYSIHWLLTGKGEKIVSSHNNVDTPLLARQIGELIREEVQRAVSNAGEKQNDAQPKVVVLRADELKFEKPKKKAKLTKKQT